MIQMTRNECLIDGNGRCPRLTRSRRLLLITRIAQLSKVRGRAPLKAHPAIMLASAELGS